MNRHLLSILCLVGVVFLAALAFLLRLKRQNGSAFDAPQNRIEIGRVSETMSGDSIAFPEEPSATENDLGPGWHGEDLHAGFKMIRDVRSNLYDYNRRLAERPKPYPLSEDIAKAETRGADFKLSFAVRDQHGEPVKRASVVIGAFQRGPGVVFSGETDDNGIATITGFGTGELLVTFTNLTHYGSSFRYEFYDPYFECAKDGRWLPWNPLLPVTMVRKGKGEVSLSYDATFTIPKGECEIGVDLIRGEVATLEKFHGTPNCILRFSFANAEDGEEKPMTLCFDFMEEGCGGQMDKRDMFSFFPFPTVAPHEGYERQLRFAWCRENVSCHLPRMMEDDTMLFRVRAEDGRFRYGVIKRPLSGTSSGTYLRLMVSVNADHPDSRNLEPASGSKVKYKHFKIGKNVSPQPGDARKDGDLKSKCDIYVREKSSRNPDFSSPVDTAFDKSKIHSKSTILPVEKSQIPNFINNFINAC